MSEHNSLINLGGLAKPATVLIEKVSDAVGGIAKPWQIERVAKAEAKADLIRASNRIEISELEERALKRLVREEGEKQQNIENITAKAIPHLSAEAKPEALEKDWLTHFFDRCRGVSDEEMQSLWAQVLAGQSNKTGSFSKRTIEIVAALDKSDAELFTNFCSFVWLVGDETPIILDLSAEIYKNSGLNFHTLSHLDAIGLINFDKSRSLAKVLVPDTTTVFYFGRPLIVNPVEETLLPNIGKHIPVGHAFLTEAGRQLSAVCEAKPARAIPLFVISSWVESGCILSIPCESKELWMSLN